MRIEALSGWTSKQRHVVAACFLGWTLDAFDFFLLVFVLKDIAQEFNTQISLNELSPDDARGTFPGFVYQLGNLIASFNATLQAGIAAHYGGNYALALAVVAGTVAVAIVILTAFGIEAKGVAFGTGRIRGPADPRTAASSDAI